MRPFKLLAALCVVLLGLYNSIAFADTRPIITLSVGLPFLTSEQRTDPKPATARAGHGVYNINIFANGRVEYNGLYAMKVIGKLEYQIDKKTLNKLLKDIDKERALLGAELGGDFYLKFTCMGGGGYIKPTLDFVPIFGVRFRSGQKDITVRGSTAAPFYLKILDAIKSEQLGNLHIVFRPLK